MWAFARRPGGPDGTTEVHPLDPLSADELRRAVSILRADPRIAETARFADVYHDEPAKATLIGPRAADIDRRVCFRLVTGPELACTEALVSLTSDQVLAVTEGAGGCVRRCSSERVG